MENEIFRKSFYVIVIVAMRRVTRQLKMIVILIFRRRRSPDDKFRNVRYQEAENLMFKLICVSSTVASLKAFNSPTTRTH